MLILCVCVVYLVCAQGETGEAQIGSGHSSDDSKSSEGSEQDMEEALREQVADMGQELIYYTSALAELEDRVSDKQRPMACAALLSACTPFRELGQQSIFRVSSCLELAVNHCGACS